MEDIRAFMTVLQREDHIIEHKANFYESMDVYE